MADLVNSLARRGHNVSVALAPRSPVAEILTEIPRENIIELRLRNALDAPSALRLARFIREREIEIAHAHVARDYPLAALAARYAGHTQLIITRHFLRPLSKIHRLTLARVARVIAPSEATARALREQKLFPEEKISVVVSGIDCERFERAARAIDRAAYRQRLAPDARFLIGIAGELREHKGQDIFLRAAALVAARFPAARFLIAGEDNSPKKEYRAHLERLVAELQLAGCVRFLGWLEAVAPFYAALDVLVSASRTEAFGIVLIEAMASGAAVVATATAGAREIINDGVTGHLVPIDDAEALASALISLLADETKRRRLREQARDMARARFSLTRMTDETEKIYREVLGKH